MTSEAETMVERIARIIADHCGATTYDDAHEDKAEWRVNKGYRNGRFLDTSVAFKADYLEAARRVFCALSLPSDAMIEAGGQALLDQTTGSEAVEALTCWRAMIQAALQPEAVRRILSETPHAE